jgi:hypothetical protein
MFHKLATELQQSFDAYNYMKQNTVLLARTSFPWIRKVVGRLPVTVEI